MYPRRRELDAGETREGNYSLAGQRQEGQDEAQATLTEQKIRRQILSRKMFKTTEMFMTVWLPTHLLSQFPIVIHSPVSTLLIHPFCT